MVVVNEDNFSITRFSGLNQTADPRFIEDYQLAECLNMLVYDNGMLKKRNGIDQFTSLTATGGPFNAVYMLGQLIVTDGSPSPGTAYSFIAQSVAGVNNYHYLTEDSITPTNIPGLTGKIIWDVAQWNNILYLAGEDAMYKWTPSGGLVTMTDTPVALRHLEVYKNIMWGFRNDRLYYSQPLDADTWELDGVLQFLEINSKDGDKITAMVPYGDRLIIFKDSTTWALYGVNPDTWTLRCINFEVGCTGPNAVRISHNLIYVIDRHGVWVTDANIWTRLDNEIRLMTTSQERHLSNDLFADHIGIYKDWLFVHVKFLGDFAYRYTSPKGWTELQWFRGSQYNWWPIQEQKLYNAECRYILSVDTNMYMFLPENTSTESFATRIDTKFYDIERISRTKRVKYATVHLAGHTNAHPNMTWLVDISDTVTPTVENPIDELALQQKSIKARGPGYGRVFSISLTETSQWNYEFQGFNLILHLERQQMLAKQ